MERKPLGSPKTAPQLLDMYYLDLRCHLLEAAATLDRIDRADSADRAKTDPRRQKLEAALAILAAHAPGRTERFLELFSE